MKISLKYTGMPIHLIIDGVGLRWTNVLNVLDYIQHDTFIIDGFEYLPKYALIYFEEHNRWRKQYLPPYGIMDKVVLDIGAGCGESAKFFLDYGASKVICIECNDLAYSYLEKNSKVDSRIIPIHKSFEGNDLSKYEHDFTKIDIDGYETPYLYEIINHFKPCVIEAHNHYIIDTLKNNGFKVHTYTGTIQAVMQRF